jgi:hypothetical protein
MDTLLHLGIKGIQEFWAICFEMLFHGFEKPCFCESVVMVRHTCLVLAHTDCKLQDGRMEKSLGGVADLRTSPETLMVGKELLEFKVTNDDVLDLLLVSQRRAFFAVPVFVPHIGQLDDVTKMDHVKETLPSKRINAMRVRADICMCIMSNYQRSCHEDLPSRVRSPATTSR